MPHSANTSEPGGERAECVVKLSQRDPNSELWTSGYLDIWISGYLHIWIFGFSDIWILGYLDIWISGYLDIWIHVFGYLDI